MSEKSQCMQKTKSRGLNQNRTQVFCVEVKYSTTEPCRCLKLLQKVTSYSHHVGQGVAFTDEILRSRSIEL